MQKALHILLANWLSSAQIKIEFKLRNWQEFFDVTKRSLTSTQRAETTWEKLWIQVSQLGFEWRPKLMQLNNWKFRVNCFTFKHIKLDAFSEFKWKLLLLFNWKSVCNCLCIHNRNRGERAFTWKSLQVCSKSSKAHLSLQREYAWMWIE
jgi:hypothetical protein